MLIEVEFDTGMLRLDRPGFDALLEAARADGAPGHPEAVMALGSGRLDRAMAAIAEPLVTISLTVAGQTTRLEHQAWVTRKSAALLLGVQQGLFQLMTQDPAFLTAALVRLTRMRPRRVSERADIGFPPDRLDALVDADEDRRRTALADAYADFAWHLEARWDGGERRLTAVDGPRGLHLADPGSARLVPVSNTFAYRILSTVLPADTDLGAG